MASPLVSVIIPVFNRGEILTKTVESVATQTYPNVEIIIVDDGSTEDIETIVQDLRPRVRFPMHYIRQENSGPGVARRTGLENARGEFIQYLDSDDEILSEKIELQVEMMLANPQSVMCYTIAINDNNNGSRTTRKFSNLPADDLLSTALQYRRWGTPSCLWRYPDKAVARWSNLYNGEDVVHDVTVGIQHREILFLPKALTIIKKANGQLSEVPKDQARFERYKSDIFSVNVLSYHALETSGLHRNPGYAEPLAERFYFIGLKLAKMGDVERAIASLRYVSLLSRKPLRTLETVMASLAIRLTKARSPSLYHLLFRVHRKLVSPYVHCYRTV